MTQSMSRITRTGATLVALGTLLALAPGASAAPAAVASKACKVGDSRSYGTTYVLSISVRGTSCRAGRRLIRAFHACRPGKSGHCGHVNGYSCSESRYDKIKTQYSSRVTCRKGDNVVKHTYTQFT
jgi:hypothetical protein